MEVFRLTYGPSTSNHDLFPLPSVPVGVRGVHPHHEGDGTSDSSIGTESPDLYNPVRGGREGDGDAEPPLGATDVQVTAEDLASGAPYLLVRQGSDPPFIGVEDETKSWRSLPQSQSSNNPADAAQGSSQSLANVSKARYISIEKEEGAHELI